MKAFTARKNYQLANFVLANNNQQKKFNYFVDYFRFYNSHLGEIPNMEIESHISLLEKIEFQIKHNSTHAKKYCNLYLHHFFFTKNDILLNKFYSREYQTLNTWRNAPPKEKKELQKLKRDIIPILKVFKKSLFENTIFLLFENLSGTKSLNETKKELKYFSGIIISELYRVGYSFEAIQSLLYAIMSKYYEQNNFIWTDFPVENNILKLFKLNRKEKLNNEELKSHLNKYFDSLTFQDRILSINRVYKSKEYSCTFLFKVDNFRTEEKFFYQYQNVSFQNCSAFYEKNKNRIHELDEYFFANPVHTIIAEVTEKAHDQNMAVYKAVCSVSAALNYMNFGIMNANGILNLSEYILYEKDEQSPFFINSTFDENHSQDIRFRYLDYKNLNRIYQKKLSTKKYGTIVNAQRIFYEAFNCWKLDLKMLLFWTYLEALLNPVKENLKQILNTDDEGKLVTAFFSRLLCTQVNFDTQQPLFYYLSNVVYNLQFYNSPWKIDVAKTTELINNLDAVKKEIKNDFVQDVIKMYEELKGNIPHRELSYYENVLLQLYETRNAIVHSGNYNMSNLVKLNCILKPIINRINNIIIAEAHANDEKNLLKFYKEILAGFAAKQNKRSYE